MMKITSEGNLTIEKSNKKERRECLGEEEEWTLRDKRVKWMLLRVWEELVVTKWLGDRVVAWDFCKEE